MFILSLNKINSNSNSHDNTLNDESEYDPTRLNIQEKSDEEDEELDHTLPFFSIVKLLLFSKLE